MTRTNAGICAGVALLAVALTAGCATPKKTGQPIVEKDVARVIRLADGSTCEEPAGIEQTRQAPGAIALKELFESDAGAEDALAKAATITLSAAEVEAVFFDACRAYSSAAIGKDAFAKDRQIYLGLRQQFFTRGVKDWQDKKDGIADAGKLCLVSLPDTDPDHRSFTRVVPPEASVYDCAQLAAAKGSSEILLGCTAGHWKNTWAKRPITLSAKTRALVVKGTAFAPDPDCGWN
ncbi:MAG: hypothetical protein ABI648_07330 [Betaproteobacteria bacterium]